MTFKSTLTAASTALLLATGAASATTATITSIDPTTVNGTFSAYFHVSTVNVTNLNSAESQATVDNYNAGIRLVNERREIGNDPEVEVAYSAQFYYDGALDFGTSTPGNTTTIGNFIASGSGTTTGFDFSGGYANLANSSADITAGTATTTFYFFSAQAPIDAGTFNIAHDDGVSILGLGGNVGPTWETGTRIEGFGGGGLAFIYASTNNDPSIFRVDYEALAVPAPVPLPAAGWMLLAGLGALGAVARRRKAA